MDSVDRPEPGLSRAGDRVVLESASPPPPGCALPALGALLGVALGFALFVRAESFVPTVGACVLAAAVAFGCPPRSLGRRFAGGLSIGCAVGAGVGVAVAVLFRNSFNPAGL